MSTLENIADNLSGFAAFATSAIGSGLLAIALAYPSVCTGDIPHRTCKNALGGAAMSQSSATTTATIAGFVVGGLALLVRSMIVDYVQSERAKREAALNKP